MWGGGAGEGVGGTQLDPGAEVGVRQLVVGESRTHDPPPPAPTPPTPGGANADWAVPARDDYLPSATMDPMRVTSRGGGEEEEEEGDDWEDEEEGEEGDE